MKVYFDTNVLVAAVRSQHEHHGRSYAALAKAHSGLIEGCISGQVLAEFYSVLTRSPHPMRVSPDEVEMVVLSNVVPLLRPFEIATATYLRAIEVCAGGMWRGGRVHDAVHVQAAAQAGCEAIYTWNVRDFESVRGGFAGRIEAPPPE